MTLQACHEVSFEEVVKQKASQISLPCNVYSGRETVCGFSCQILKIVSRLKWEFMLFSAFEAFNDFVVKLCLKFSPDKN